jgi:FkbM family methyltransferase
MAEAIYMQFLYDNSFEVSFSRVYLEGFTYFIPEYAKHRPACKRFLAGQLHELDTHQSVAAFLDVFPGNIIHAGTFFGDMIPAFSIACGLNGSVYAFEPVLENYILARLCIDENRLENVLLFNAALADKVSTCSIRRFDKGPTHLGGASRISDSGDVSSVALTVDTLRLSQLSVLQLDVEGFELKALVGSRATIEQCRPLIMIEDNKKECDAFLTGLSYTRVGRMPGLAVWSPDERSDFIAPMRPFLKS